MIRDALSIMFQSVIGRGGYGAAFVALEPHYSPPAASTYNCSPWSSPTLSAAAAARSPWQPTVNNSFFVSNFSYPYSGLHWSQLFCDAPNPLHTFPHRRGSYATSWQQVVVMKFEKRHNTTDTTDFIIIIIIIILLAHK